MNTRFWRHLEDKTRENARRLEKQKAESPSLELVPPLLVVLRHDLGKLPAGIVIQFPHEVAINLIRHRYAVPVASFDALPDLIVDEDQLRFTGFEPSLLPLEVILEPALEAA